MSANLCDLSIVVPALDAAGVLPSALEALPAGMEIVVVDGGSTDATAAIAERAGATVIRAPRGRGGQIAAGVARATGRWLLLLHADTRLGPGWREAAVRHMAGPADRAGYFRLAFDSGAPEARRMERVVAWRARVLGLPYGDQGLLISRTLLARVGGMRGMPLMEDVDLARRIGRRRLVALDAVALTSAARYERDGWRLRSARNLCCLALYFTGTRPRWIAKLYG